MNPKQSLSPCRAVRSPYLLPFQKCYCYELCCNELFFFANEEAEISNLQSKASVWP